MKGPVYLLGLMGSGKTTVGRLLADALGWPWTDLDQTIERRSGKKVAAIFEQKGEAAFRRLESSELARLSRKREMVVSCGGGVVLQPDNRRILRKGLAVYLAASPALLAGRLKGAEARQRPLLKGGNAAFILGRLRRQRAVLYRQCAAFWVRAAGDPADVAKRILARMKRMH